MPPPSPLLTRLSLPPYSLRDPICCSGRLRGADFSRRPQVRAMSSPPGGVPLGTSGDPGLRASLATSWVWPQVYPISSGAISEGGPAPAVALPARLVPSVPSAPRGAPGWRAGLSPCTQQSPGGHGDPLGGRAAALRCVPGVKLSPHRPQEGLRAQAEQEAGGKGPDSANGGLRLTPGPLEGGTWPELAWPEAALPTALVGGQRAIAGRGQLSSLCSVATWLQGPRESCGGQ